MSSGIKTDFSPSGARYNAEREIERMRHQYQEEMMRMQEALMYQIRPQWIESPPKAPAVSVGITYNPAALVLLT